MSATASAQEHEHSNRVRALAELIGELDECDTPEAIATRTAHALVTLVDVQSSSLVRIQPDAQHQLAIATSEDGEPEDTLWSTTLPVHELRRQTRAAVLTGEHVPTLIVPIRINGELWGALRGRRPGSFDADDLALTEVIAALTEGAIARADLAEQVRHLVQDDTLTGLSTRWAADAAIRSALDSGTETCVAMCDVDGLKRVNDDLGHDAGDDVLRAVAGVLRHAGSRLPGSTVARIGGDEFCLVTLGIPRRAVVKAIAESLASVDLPYGTSLSYGVASSARRSLGGQQTARSLVRRADAAQYHAKRDRAAALARRINPDSVPSMLSRTVSASVAVISRDGAGPLERLCALAPTLSDAMGGSAWAVYRIVETTDNSDGQTEEDWVAVARGGSPVENTRVRPIEVRESGWAVTVEGVLSDQDHTVKATLQTLMSLAVLGAD